jgi:hypothetical protein
LSVVEDAKVRLRAYDVVMAGREADSDLLGQLDSQDVCLVRKGYELEGRIREEAKEKGLKAKVEYWSAAWEVDE